MEFIDYFRSDKTSGVISTLKSNLKLIRTKITLIENLISEYEREGRSEKIAEINSKIEELEKLLSINLAPSFRIIVSKLENSDQLNANFGDLLKLVSTLKTDYSKLADVDKKIGEIIGLL